MPTRKKWNEKFLIAISVSVERCNTFFQTNVRGEMCKRRKLANATMSLLWSFEKNNFWTNSFRLFIEIFIPIKQLVSFEIGILLSIVSIGIFSKFSRAFFLIWFFSFFFGKIRNFVSLLKNTGSNVLETKMHRWIYRTTKPKRRFSNSISIAEKTIVFVD